MDLKKSQAINFAFEVIPVMFHSQTSEFLKYIEKDGLKFLEFWWNYIGDQLPEGQQCSFEGMAYQFIEIDKRQTVILITLPEPHDDGEAFFLLLIARPEKHFAWIRLPSTRVVAMIRQVTPQEDGTEVGDITPRGIYVRISKGPAPTVQNMTNMARKLVQSPSS